MRGKECVRNIGKIIAWETPLWKKENDATNLDVRETGCDDRRLLIYIYVLPNGKL
jgi:hypothetical protein